jgi:hypothetical protein
MGADKHDPKALDSGPAIIRPDKPMRFFSLHHHTTHSYKDGYGSPDAHHARAAELGSVSGGPMVHRGRWLILDEYAIVRVSKGFAVLRRDRFATFLFLMTDWSVSYGQS